MNKVKEYTNGKIEEMYVDWFNNFITSDAWRQYYQLSIDEGENILDIGRQLNNLRNYE